MKTTVDAKKTGLTLTPRRSSRYPEEKLSNLDYADDIALFETNERNMSDTTEAIRKSAGKLGLMMSFRKTEILTVGPSSSQKPNVPLGDEGNIKVVENFKYLKVRTVLQMAQTPTNSTAE